MKRNKFALYYYQRNYPCNSYSILNHHNRTLMLSNPMKNDRFAKKKSVSKKKNWINILSIHNEFLVTPKNEIDFRI